MKTTILSVLAAAVMCAPAIASDYIETETVTSHEIYRVQPTETVRVSTTPARRVVVGTRPCAAARATVAKPAPVAVKTYSEVIDHYQVYQPVVEYVPMGTYTTRRPVAAPCAKCGM